MGLPPIPAQGDAKRLTQLSRGVHMQNGTSGPLVQADPVGRPPGTKQMISGVPQQQYQVPQEHQDLASQLATAESTAQFWASWAQKYPGPNADYYAQQAQLEAEQLRESFYKATPNFHNA